MRAESDEPRLEQLERAVAVLQVFDAEHPRLTISEVTRLTQTTRASARSILLTFQSLGLLRSEGRHFSLTSRVLDLGWEYFSSLSAEEIATPLLRDLVDTVGESCSMTTLDLPDVVYVAGAHTKGFMKASVGTGSRLPAHATASGLVLLGTLSDCQLRRYLAAPLQAFTPRTTTDPGELRELVMAAREQGWALIDEGLELGLCGIAVPVHTRSGKIVAALSAYSTTARTTVQDLQQRCLPALRATARALSTCPGATPSEVLPRSTSSAASGVLARSTDGESDGSPRPGQ